MGGGTLQEVTTILFDLDNTLIDTKGADRRACNQVLAMLINYGVKRQYAKEACDKFYNFVREQPHDPSEENGNVDAWRTILWRQALGPKLSTFDESCYQLWKSDRIKYMKFTSELEGLLIELRQTYKLGLITNGPSAAQWEKIHRVNGLLYFDAIVVSGDVEAEKPHPSIFDEIFRRLDVSSLECIMVGDKLETDIKGGIKSNCAATVWFTTSGEPLDNVHPKPDFKIDNVKDLLDILPKRSRFTSLHYDKALGLYHRLHEETPTWRKKLQW